MSRVTLSMALNEMFTMYGMFFTLSIWFSGLFCGFLGSSFVDYFLFLKKFNLNFGFAGLA